MQGSLALCVFAASGCSTDEAPEEDGQGKPDASEQSTGSSEDPDEDPTPSPGAEDDGSSTEAPTSSSNSSTDTPSGGETQDPELNPRDCDKIEWGSELKEGSVIERGDVQGYVDSDGDGAVEKEEQDAGMCQLHKTGKKCGLVLYSRRT